MSEYQYIGFRAVDRPLTDAELKYAQSQSTRAEITRWTFDNEYHHGDFHGDAGQLLRRGFDVHFHYANYGIRQLSIRLPDGFPCRESVWIPYVDGGRVMWDPDKRGRGGVLTVSPNIEPHSIDQLGTLHEYLDDVVGIRNELIGGDLRVLYAMWLCGCQDDDVDPDEVTEPPVPAGIDKATEPIQTLLAIYDGDPFLLTAAGETALEATSHQNDFDALLTAWTEKLPPKEARSIVHRLLREDMVALRAELMRSFRDQHTAPAWPTTPGSRTLAELLERAEVLRAKAEAAKAKRKVKRK